jgi:hypothetical protein
MAFNRFARIYPPAETAHSRPQTTHAEETCAAYAPLRSAS